MAELIASRSITLSAANPVLESPRVSIAGLTETIRIRLRRPTDAAPLNWTEAGRMRVTLAVVIDGQEYSCSSEIAGGVWPRGAVGAAQQQWAELTWLVPIVTDKATKLRYRIGETAKTSAVGYIRLEHISGTVRTDIVLAAATEADLPERQITNSVSVTFLDSAVGTAFSDSVTLSITPTGTNRHLAAFLHTDFTGGTGLSATCNGNAMVELAEVTGQHGAYGIGAYRWDQGTFGELTTSTQNVVLTHTGFGGNYLVGSVCVMDGVDQTTPTGNTSGPTANSADPMSVSLTGVAAGDLGLSFMYANTATASPTLTSGTYDVVAPGGSSTYFAGVGYRTGEGSLSWTGQGTSGYNGIYGVVFKEATGGGGGSDPPPGNRIFMLP